MATVSVIMPAYNVAGYIGEAMASVVAQTMTDWELLVVDDGSTDDTAARVRELAAREPRIRFFQKDNGGISSARNVALRESTGAFLAILDSDDVWEPNYLSEQLAIFAAHPGTDIVTGNGWFRGSSLDGQFARPYPDARPQPTLATILGDETSIFIMSVFRRRVYEAVGEFDENLRTNEDYDFWLRAAIAGFTFRRNDKPLCHYRRRDDSLSAVDARMLAGILRVFRKLRPQLADRPEELAIADRQIERFEREALAAEARMALKSGDTAAAATHLSALYARGGGPAIGVASFMARRMPRLLARAYQLRRACHGAA
jgi:glycosyltransferase involved in cell wall biosynthesis